MNIDMKEARLPAGFRDNENYWQLQVNHSTNRRQP